MKSDPSTLAAIAETIKHYEGRIPAWLVDNDSFVPHSMPGCLTLGQLRALHAMLTNAPPPQSLLDTLIQKAVFSEDVTIWHLTQPEYYAIKALVEAAAAPQPNAPRPFNPETKAVWVSTREIARYNKDGYAWPCVFDHKRDGAVKYVLPELQAPQPAGQEVKYDAKDDAALTDIIRQIITAAVPDRGTFRAANQIMSYVNIYRPGRRSLQAPQPAPLTSREGRTGAVNEAEALTRELFEIFASTPGNTWDSIAAIAKWVIDRRPAEQEAKGDWMPIETAPKDGRRILAWCKDWTAPLTVQFYGTHWSFCDDCRQAHQPTHWQPLPTAPDRPA